jgi:hypothetical protein
VRTFWLVAFIGCGGKAAAPGVDRDGSVKQLTDASLEAGYAAIEAAADVLEGGGGCPGQPTVGAACEAGANMGCLCGDLHCWCAATDAGLRWACGMGACGGL